MDKESKINCVNCNRMKPLSNLKYIVYFKWDREVKGLVCKKCRWFL